MKLANKVAVVTGAASGIGQATAEIFAEDGASVTVADVNVEAAERVVAGIIQRSGRAIAVRTDVSKAGDAQAMVAATVEAFGGLDILVSNAGAMLLGTAVSTSEEDWDRIFAVNVRGGFLCSKYAIPEMRKRGGGAILFTASTGGLEGFNGQLAYCASKAAIVSMVQTMALDHAQHNIRVNCVCPGPVRTPMSAATLQKMGPGVMAALDQRLKQFIPYQARLAEPREIAAALLFLASDEASFITGHALVVDGAQTAGRFVPELVEP